MQKRPPFAAGDGYFDVVLRGTVSNFSLGGACKGEEEEEEEEEAKDG